MVEVQRDGDRLAMEITPALVERDGQKLWTLGIASATVALGAVVLVALVWWPAALTLLGCLLAAGCAAALWGWAAGSRAERDIAPLRARLADAVVDHLGSLDVLLAYGAEAASRARIADADAALRRAVVRHS